MIDADITFRLIDTPISKWCSSGHLAHNKFQRTRDGAAEPVRFFRVSSKNVEGCYCEPCVIIATQLAQQKKKEMKGK